MTRQQTERTIVFVDLAGFTALTDAHGDARAADAQQAFVATLREALAGSVECVKHLGDGALLAATEPVEALRCLGVLARSWAADVHAPLLRAGAYAGPVLLVATDHGPDYLGGTVNTAARLCEAAAGGRLVHGQSLTPAAIAAGLRSRPLGPLVLRGLAAPVEVGEVAFAPVDPLIDPVCRMPVPPGTAAGTLRHAGRTWSFCSLGCAARFATDPARYDRHP